MGSINAIGLGQKATLGERSRFPTPDSRLPIPNSRLPTPDSRFPIPDSRLPLPPDCGMGILPVTS
ncbi:hypothetical protein [Moorena sp. SIO3H5]|uniref:hypothetical protein n=1 Tax=Moorena sp. SIO3H5 TaxID=2607834 RepID=UPI0013BDD43D|nr:hypothetical protein [Moorena sp. SIO3H5]NEO71453.1 hypothetical protein [Moorena sp. SIO3H5]